MGLAAAGESRWCSTWDELECMEVDWCSFAGGSSVQVNMVLCSLIEHLFKCFSAYTGRHLSGMHALLQVYVCTCNRVPTHTLHVSNMRTYIHTYIWVPSVAHTRFTVYTLSVHGYIISTQYATCLGISNH